MPVFHIRLSEIAERTLPQNLSIPLAESIGLRDIRRMILSIVLKNIIYRFTLFIVYHSFIYVQCSYGQKNNKE